MLSAYDIHTVVIDASGSIVVIGTDASVVRKWMLDNGRDIDCIMASVCSLTELTEYLAEHSYPSFIG